MQPELGVAAVVEAPVAVVEITGELTTSGEDAMSSTYNSLPDEVQALVLDFGGLEYMNSGGIGVLVTLLIRANRSGRSVHVFGLDDHYRQIFKLTRLDEAIAIHESKHDALAAAKGAV